MKTVFKIFAGIVMVIALLGVGGGIYLKFFLPNIKVPIGRIPAEECFP
jgi:hypothetical protein